MKTVTYETSTALKTAEVDNYQEGCDPDTMVCFDVDVTFKADTLALLLHKIKEYYNVKHEGLLLNSCEELGRLDIQRLETAESFEPSDSQLKQWKQGNVELWLAAYSYQINKVTREAVQL